MDNGFAENKITTIGLVGLGLMGQGICSCLISNGFNVIAYSRTAAREKETFNHITVSLNKLLSRKIIAESDTREWEKRFTYVNNLEELRECKFIIETVGEDLELKRKIYKTLESVISEKSIIVSNTSGMSISLLQEQLNIRERFLGMHWAEPAEITRFLEIAPGKQTGTRAIQITRDIGIRCGKEPTILNFELPGLISNRLMYAMLREALNLVESGVADIEMIDRSFRNDIGWWATICGPFRWMDLTGLPIYAKVMEGLLPDLSNSTDVPKVMREKAENGTKFYDYPEGKEKAWEDVWTEFTHDIREIVDKYEKRIKLSE